MLLPLERTSVQTDFQVKLKNLYIELNSETVPASATVVFCQSPLALCSVTACVISVPSAEFPPAPCERLFSRHTYKEDASPPWQTWQYQIGVHHSKVKQKRRGDQRLSTAASFNEDCRREK